MAHPTEQAPQAGDTRLPSHPWTDDHPYLAKAGFACRQALCFLGEHGAGYLAAPRLKVDQTADRTAQH